MDVAPSYPGIRTPIGTLPNELLCHIFTMGAASQPSDWEHLPFPLLVSSISRRWREAAISSPPLWSQLFFTADPRSDFWCACLFLPRSGAHPLDINIKLRNRCGSADIVQQLLPYSERWRKLYIRVAGNHEVLTLKRSIWGTSVPFLQHFELSCKGECIDGIGDTHDAHTSFFNQSTPALTSVKLRGLCLDCAPPLVNLTSYRFDSKATFVTQSQMESIAAACPALRVLHLRFEGFEGSESGSINLPSLRELSLNFRHYPPISGIEPLHIFAIMLAPALESLEIVALHGYEVHELNGPFQRFPNYPRPRTLKLSLVIALETCNTLLDLFPTAVSLSLLDTVDEPTLSLLPALKHITYNHVVWFPSPEGLGSPRNGYLEWLCRHAQECRGTPRAMESVRVGPSMRGDHGDAHYRTLRDLVDLRELPDGADSLQNSWSSDDEFEREEYDEDDLDGEYDQSNEEDDEDDLGDHWEDYMDDGNSDYEIDFEDENAWQSD